METSLDHADERDLIETFVERSRWHCRAARETFSTDACGITRPISKIARTFFGGSQDLIRPVLSGDPFSRVVRGAGAAAELDAMQSVRAAENASACLC